MKNSQKETLKWLSLKCMMVWGLFLLGHAIQAEKKLFILLGQSNMAGRAEIQTRDFATIPNAYLFNSDGEFEQARNPLNLHSSIRKETYRQRLGPGYSFAQAMERAYPEDSILLIVNARGGTEINDFLKGSDTKYYEKTIERIRLALIREPHAKIETVIWHQGESDRFTAQKYLPKLKKLIADYRQDLKHPELPIIVGQLGLWNPDYVDIRNEIQRVEETVPNAYLVSSSGLTNFDTHHFDNRSQRLLGLRYARRYLDIKSVPLSTKLRSTRVSSFDALKEMIDQPIDGYVLVAAHRGDWRNAAENSLQSIQSAIDMGVDIVEIDVAMTADSIVVLMHDKYLDRTTTCLGKVSDQSYEDLNNCRLKDGLQDPTPYPIPTLEQALHVVKGKALINLDKAEDFIQVVYPLLKKTNTLDHAIFSSYYPYSKLRGINGAYLDSVLYMPKVKHSTTNPEHYLDEFSEKTESIILQTRALSEQDTLLQIIPYAKNKDMLVWINSLEDFHCAGHTDEKALYDPDSHWTWFLDQGANIIQTDRPEWLLNYLKNRDLHD